MSILLYSLPPITVPPISVTSYNCSSNKCYFSVSVTKNLLPKILQRGSVICLLLQCHSPFFVK
jgi:hypothetical protein